MDNALSTLRQNLSSLAPFRQSLDALADGQLAELAAICRAGGDPADEFRRVYELPLCTPEFARLCRLSAGGNDSAAVLAQYLPEPAITEDSLPNTRTAYLRNAYSDRAFALFSTVIDRPSAQYQPSFSASCEEVYYGRCSYCLLPIQSSDDGILTSFSHMIAKYDLKITYICDVAMQDGDITMRYALLRRGLELRAPKSGYFQATFILPESVSPGAFLAACEETGAAIDRITTIPLHYTNDIVSLSICFRIDRKSTAPLLLFLHSVLESYTPDGIFELVR